MNERDLREDTDPARELRYVDISAVGRGELVQEPVTFAFGDAPSRARRLVRAGDSIISTVRTYLRAVWRVPPAYEDIVVSTGFAVLSPRVTDPNFFGWAVQSDEFIEEVVSRSVGVSYPAISPGDLSRIQIPVPPIDAQVAVSGFLQGETVRIDALIARKRRLIELVDQRLSATISNALWQTSHYNAVRLKHLTGRPTSGNRDHASFTWSDVGVPCLRGLNIRPSRIEQTDLLRISQEDHQRHATTALVPGDVVVVRSGLAGAAAVVPESLGECNCVDLVVIRRSSRLLPRYLELVLNSRETQEEVGLNTAGALLTHFNAVDAGELAIPYRSLESQHRIVQLLDGLASESASLGDRLTRQIELLKEHRQALITAAVTGELEVGSAA